MQETKNKRSHHSLFQHSTPPDKDLRRNLSSYTDVLNLLLAEVNMPATCRPFVDVVVGASMARRGWVELSDYELGSRLSARKEKSNVDSIKKRAQRHRKPFEEWQIDAGIELIKIEHGGKAKGEELSTRYNVDKLFDVWSEAVLLVERSADRERNPDAAKRHAAKKLAHKLGGTPERRFRGNQRPTDPYSECLRLQKAAVTLSAKSLVSATRAGHDPQYVLFELKRMIDEKYEQLLRGEIDERQVKGTWWNEILESEGEASETYDPDGVDEMVHHLEADDTIHQD